MLSCCAYIHQCRRTLLCSRLLEASASLPFSTVTLRPHSSHHHVRLTSSSWSGRSHVSIANIERPEKSFSSNSVPVPYTKHKQRAIAESSVFSKRSLEIELSWLGDMLKLSDHTLKLLQKDDFHKAFELVKLASKNHDCTVSWNHLINYEMGKGRVASAVNLFNDLKKRGLQPDAHTFTILFRGLSWHSEYPQILARALSIYQSMSAENCPVKPSIIHTNAVLQVCARCGDIDALFGIAAKLPSHGPGAADNFTYSTILNAIRAATMTGLADDTPETKAERKRRATRQGRIIWAEIINHWQRGGLRIDEELVCAMGRLLLAGDSTRDCEDVFALVEQTMGIKRPLPRTDRFSPAAVLIAPPDFKAPSDHTVGTTSPLDGPLDIETPSSEFNPVVKPNSRKELYIQPGRNTLSMLVDACVRLRNSASGQEYWKILTDSDGQYNVTPDSENFHMYLRLLRVQRASKLAAELVSNIRFERPGWTHLKLEAKTFRIALSACVRDSMNPNVLDNAGKLIRMMLDKLSVPDVKALEMYLEVALKSQGRNWRTLMGVIRGSTLGIRSLRSYLSYEAPAENTGNVKKGELKVSTEEVVHLATKLISAYDITINTGGEAMSSKERADCMEQRSILAAWVTRLNHMPARVEKKQAYVERIKGLKIKQGTKNPEQGRTTEGSAVSKIVRRADDDDYGEGLAKFDDGYQQSKTYNNNTATHHRPPPPPPPPPHRKSTKPPLRRTEGGMRKRRAMLDQWNEERGSD